MRQYANGMTGTSPQQQAVGEHVSKFFGYLVGFASLAAIMGFFISAIYHYNLWIVLGCVLALHGCIDYRQIDGFKKTVAFLLVLGSSAWALYNMYFTGWSFVKSYLRSLLPASQR